MQYNIPFTSTFDPELTHLARDYHQEMGLFWGVHCTYLSQKDNRRAIWADVEVMRMYRVTSSN